MKLLLDMNIPLKYTELLNKKGIETLRWSDIGVANASDSEIMAYAREHNLSVLTFDLDFSTMLSVTHESKPSIVQIRASVLYAEQTVDIIANAIMRNLDALDNGAIMSIDVKKSRIRLLPL
jgi:predicted nuclease of predicted toxin-antitoxin system